jgi:hypothetical protein
MIHELRRPPRGEEMNNQRPRAKMPPSRDYNSEPYHALCRALRKGLRDARHDQADQYAVGDIKFTILHVGRMA